MSSHRDTDTISLTSVSRALVWKGGGLYFKFKEHSTPVGKVVKTTVELFKHRAMTHTRHFPISIHKTNLSFYVEFKLVLSWLCVDLFDVVVCETMQGSPRREPMPQSMSIAKSIERNTDFISRSISLWLTSSDPHCCYPVQNDWLLTSNLARDCKLKDQEVTYITDC